MFEDIRTARGVVCYLVNIIIQQAGKEVRVCEVTRVVGQLSIVCSRSQVIDCSYFIPFSKSVNRLVTVCGSAVPADESNVLPQKLPSSTSLFSVTGLYRVIECCCCVCGHCESRDVSRRLSIN